MDLINNKPIIICAGVGGWYPVGAKRLESNLRFHGWPWVKIWTDYPPNSIRHEDVPYYFKISAFEWALSEGYTHIMWCDSSFWPVKSPMPLFDFINDNGFYMFRSGFNLSQSVNDAALNYTGITRDEAEGIVEYASGCVGINFKNEQGKALYNKWKEYMDLGLSKGSRLHDRQSEDPRFLFHRQDQSCLSLAAHKLGLGNNLMLDSVSYYGTNYSSDDLIFFIQGM